MLVMFADENDDILLENIQCLEIKKHYIFMFDESETFVEQIIPGIDDEMVEVE